MLGYTKQSSEKGIIVDPAEPPIGSVIWLHGLGADGNDFLSIIPELQLPKTLPLRFVFPHAPMRPVTINFGYVMRAWFDLASPQFDQRIDEEGIRSSIQLVNKFIDQEEKSGIPSEKIILAGFSQGAVIALCTGLCFPKKLGGIIGLSGALPLAERVISEASEENRDIPIFIGHGTEDPIVPFELGESTQAALKQEGYPVTWHHYPMPHSVCPDEINDIATWVKKIY